MTPAQKRKRKQKKACSSGKVPYESKESAIFFGRADRLKFGDRMHAYECAECSKWHVATKRVGKRPDLDNLPDPDRGG